ncbi:MAG: hypothetical protein BMS9Abin36_1078 [Gammaproteobacteria bacterium]|nr:MAG: hypothetical protein BMS9Abin36_1078 [Gammaproteobacteria bacterium]
MKIKSLALALILGLSAVSAQADPFDEGLTYYISGHPDKALTVWQPLAVQGHADAQFHLGHMYRQGEGVEQNDRTALKWYRMASMQGHKTAEFQARLLREKLSPNRFALR